MSDSEIVESVPLNLDAVWIHDPDDPAGTIVHYPYSASDERSDSIGIESTGNFYAGRVFPVFDISEHESDVMSVGLSIIRNDPYFPGSGTLTDLQRFVRSRKSVTVRDGSGRGATGPINNLATDGVHYGYAVSFEVEQADLERVIL